MNISDACKTIRAWNDVFTHTATERSVPGDLHDAAAELKRYLEEANGDGKPIAELQIAEHLLATRVGLKWVMPFVLSAESRERSGRAKGLGYLDSPPNPSNRAIPRSGGVADLGTIARLSAEAPAYSALPPVVADLLPFQGSETSLRP